jgi:hypothetical protein
MGNKNARFETGQTDPLQPPQSQPATLAFSKAHAYNPAGEYNGLELEVFA